MNYIQKKGYETTVSHIYFSAGDSTSKGELLICPANIENAQISVSETSTSILKWSAISNFQINLIEWLKEVFLPRGYPHSVSSDYLQYQIWDSLQAYCSNLSGALSLHSTLVGIGVGQDSASPLAAAISWLTKDGAGMVSSITFAYYKGCDLDNNSKQWRLFADVVNDGSHFIKLVAPVLPFPFLLTLCCSSVMSSLVGVAGGATRASLIQHQALCNNMADVSAKDGSQETMVNLAGLLTSLTLLPLLTSNPIITWLSFLMFVGLHLFTNYKAMRSLKMKTLNRPRLLYIFDCLTTRAFIPDVTSANENESLFSGPAFRQNYLTQNFSFEGGESLNLVSDRFSDCQEDFKRFFFSQEANFEEDKYMLFLDEKHQNMQAIYHEKAESLHILQSFWCAYLCAINLQTKKEGSIGKEYELSYQSSIQDFVLKAKTHSKATFREVLNQLSAKGWQLDPLRLKVEEWRLLRNQQ